MNMSQRRKIVSLIMLTAATMFLLVSVRIAAQNPIGEPQVSFTPLAEPVLSRTETENWGGDCGTIFAPKVVEHQGEYYLFYTGSCKRGGSPAAIGYAVSGNGIDWNKYSNNPILTPDETGYDAMCVSIGVPFIDEGKWLLYYAANSQPCAGPGQFIGRAVADSPDGEWQRDEMPVLRAGEPKEWDAGFIMPHVVLHTEQGYVMYYSGGTEFLLPLPHLIGMATSPDGIHWTKYDDPDTRQAPYAESDPILELKEDGTTETFEAWAIDVLKTEQGWEMFYSGTCPYEIDQSCPGFIGYATSEDGIRWKTYVSPETLVLTPERVNQDWSNHCVCYPSALRHDGGYLLYFTGCTSEMNDCQIGMATGTISWNR